MADSRIPLMAGNWKMNLNHFEAIAHVQKLAFSLTDKDYAAVEVAVLTPFTDLRSVQTLVDGDKLKIKYGAQDVSQHASGAYTGEVSAAMLAKLGCAYVVVGHSERRQYHAESDALVAADAIPADRMGLDIGPESGKLFAAKLAGTKTVFWNGPMGVFEMEPYAGGTRALAQGLIDSGAFTVLGGGDSAAAVRTLGFDEDAFGHISTGGGASLEYLEGKALPGITVLEG